MRDVAWHQAEWLNRPAEVEEDGPDLVVTTDDKSDFWRVTSYGFVNDTGHALLTPLPTGTAVEVTFRTDLDHEFDQAGVLVRVDPTTWLKAGVELSDGAPQLGAVATNGRSDWSQSPVPDWAGRPVTMRASRAGDALTIRARVEDEPWRTIRLAPLDPEAKATAGPFCCSPTRKGLKVRFTKFTTGPADKTLHGEP